MYQLKPISHDAIPAAIEKVHRYRALNEPLEAESICLDVLDCEPENQQALVLLLLSRTDQIDSGVSPQRAREILPRLESPYEREYYAGLIYERAAKAQIHRGKPGSSYTAYEYLRNALAHFEKAEAIRPAGNDDAILRWNTCVRMLATHRDLREAPYEPVDAVMSE